MPLYDFYCPNCSARREALLKLDELNTATVLCLRCNQPTVRQISAAFIAADYPGYSCPVTGKWVEGRRAHIENLKQTGCRLREPGESADNARARKDADQALDRTFENSVEEAIYQLDTRKREQLTTEIQGGFDASIIRTSPKG